MKVDNLSEIIDGLDLVLTNAKGAFKDKKIDLTDFQYIINLVTNFETLQKAVEGIKDIDEEIKDIDAVEAQQIVVKLIGVLAKLK